MTILFFVARPSDLLTAHWQDGFSIGKCYRHLMVNVSQQYSFEMKDSSFLWFVSVHIDPMLDMPSSKSQMGILTHDHVQIFTTTNCTSSCQIARWRPKESRHLLQGPISIFANHRISWMSIMVARFMVQSFSWSHKFSLLNCTLLTLFILIIF